MIIKKTENFNRNNLALMFGELGFKRGAEIGVRRGDYSEILCTHIKSLEKLFSVDPWDLVYEDPRSRFEGVKKQNQYYEIAKERLAKYSACEIIRKTSMEAVKDIEYESLDFVYIDGAHTFDYVMTDLIEWGKRVRRGGIIAGDDYKQHKCGDVMTPINTYVQAHGIEVLNVIEPPKNDKYPIPNWWFIKK